MMVGEMKNKEDMTMKKMKFMLFAVAAIAAASCAKDITPENTQDTPKFNLIPMTFTAGAEGTGAEDNSIKPANVSTRVALQSDGTTLHWEGGDKIKVFDGVSNELEPFTASESGKIVNLDGNVTEGSTEFYAVYPSTAANGFNAETKTLTVTLPETQTAAAGSVPKDAFITVAKSDDHHNFAFKNLTAFVKFSLSDAANVKEVTISGNAGESLTGDMTVTIGADGTPSQSYVSNKMNSTATLKGSNFESETDYYIAIRSADFAKGLTVSIYRNDGSKSSRVYLSSPTAHEQKIDRNSVLDLGKLNVASFKTTAPKDQYLAYLHGYNVEIGDVKLHKTSGIAPKLVTAKSAGQELKNEFHDKTGDVLLFLEQNEGCSFKIGAISEIKGNVRFIGRKASSKVSLDNKGYIKLISGSLFVKNLILSQSNTEGYLTTNSGTSQYFESLYFDDCKFTNLSKNIFYNHVATYGITNISLTDCDIKISSNVTLFKEGAVTTDKMTVSNNIIYSADGNYLYILDGAGAATVTNLTYTRNSLINCYPNANSYIYMNTGTTANLSNNLFYLPDYAAKSGSSYRGILRTAAKASNPTNATVTQNHCHRLNVEAGVTMSAFKASFYDFEGLSNTMYFKQENLFTNGTFDLENGVFVSQNAAYGATR